MADFTLLPVTDLDAFAQALAAWRPDRAASAETLRQRDCERRPGEYGGRLWAMRGGEPAELHTLDFPRTENQPGWLNLLVGSREPALLPALLRAGLEEAQVAGASTVITRVQEDRPELAAYQAAGFCEYDRMFGSTLDLTAFQPSMFAARERRAGQAGLRVRSLAEELAGREFGGAEARRLYALIASRLADVPGQAALQPWPFEVWMARVGQKIDSRGLLLAVTPQGEWVGLTELFLELEPGVLHTGLTGVEPQWQGRGVALALKVAALRAAQQRGAHTAHTSNHAGNAPMLAVNRALGFVPEPATVMLRCELAG
ncbi:GNAT family N-acetyltransferase [Deinococcus sp. Marseille-Q6407]|uniref:GNAT family N-acetyltransferase n=1 Tax=Deinococcus sp. Marseille-Q6407 TaxID=2969223 RepID=UPI0021BEB3F6|nr:GNAT family protein [Deinococcus sp. Marseille-Q6407]